MTWLKQIEQLKNEKAEIENQLLETNQKLNKTKMELKIMQEQVSVYWVVTS